MDPAHPQSYRHAFDRYPHAGRSESLRNDLATIEQKETEIEHALRTVPGVADLYAERITGAPYLEIKVNREAAARYGINVGDVQDVIETAIGGKNLTTAIDGVNACPCECVMPPISVKTPRNCGIMCWSRLATARPFLLDKWLTLAW